MKNKRSIKSLLFRPFQYIAGGQSLIIGIIFLLILSFAGFLTNTYFDGVLDIHFGCLETPSSFWVHFICVFASWLILSLLMYLTAFILNRKTRIVDMFGTLAMAKTPYLLAALVGLIPSLHICFEGLSITMDREELQILMSTLLAPALISMVVIIPIIIWYIVLLYNAFSVSSNLKGSKGTIAFTIALIISELISIFVLPALIKLFGV